MDSTATDLTLPTSWEELSSRQFAEAYRLLASDLEPPQTRAVALVLWSGLKIIGLLSDGRHLCRLRGKEFPLSSMQIAEASQSLGWLTSPPSIPVRPDRIGRCRALPADFQNVPFGTFIYCDNLWQGFLVTKDDSLLDSLLRILYQSDKIKTNHERRVCAFLWFAGLKTFLAAQFSEFLRPQETSADVFLGLSPQSARQNMDAQIRALTKGDVTKEATVLAADTWRALAELDAQAREYRELNSKLKK